MQITWKNETKNISFQFFINRSSILMFFVLFFHVASKISNFIMWNAKHLMQDSCSDLTLLFGWLWGQCPVFLLIKNRCKKLSAVGCQQVFEGISFSTNTFIARLFLSVSTRKKRHHSSHAFFFSTEPFKMVLVYRWW